MRYTIFLCSMLFLFACSQTHDPSDKPRTAPRYKGVDKRAAPLIAEYVKLAKSNNIKFTNPITVGFLDIKRKSHGHSVVGTCYYAPKFREIELDNDEWNKHSLLVKKNLLFHELTHCLCSRGHDFGDGEAYYATNVEDAIRFLHGWPFNLPVQGSYPDGCPLSIMHPRMMREKCMTTHASEYMKEMFNRCDAW